MSKIAFLFLLVFYIRTFADIVYETKYHTIDQRIDQERNSKVYIKGTKMKTETITKTSTKSLYAMPEVPGMEHLKEMPYMPKEDVNLPKEPEETKTAEIVDLSKGTIVVIDYNNNTYTEKSFTQQKDILEKQISSAKETKKKLEKERDKVEVTYSEPKNEKTNEVQIINGYKCRKYISTMVETCKTKADKGEMILKKNIITEVWATEDKIPGWDEINKFTECYYQKIGLDFTKFQKQLHEIGISLPSFWAEQKIAKGVPIKIINKTQISPPPEIEKQMSEASKAKAQMEKEMAKMSPEQKAFMEKIAPWSLQQYATSEIQATSQYELLNVTPTQLSDDIFAIPAEFKKVK